MVRIRTLRWGLSCCLALILFGCPADGGDLLPLPSSGQEIRSSPSKKDVVLHATQGGLEVDASGTWSSSGGKVEYNVRVVNGGSESVTLPLNKIVQENSRQDAFALRLVENRGTSARLDPQKEAIQLEPGQRGEFFLGLRIPLLEGQTGDFGGQTATLTLPIVTATGSSLTFALHFKYGDHQAER